VLQYADTGQLRPPLPVPRPVHGGEREAGLIGAVLLEWPRTLGAVDPGFPGLASRFARLSSLGIHVVLVGCGSDAAGALISLSPPGPGRLFVWGDGEAPPVEVTRGGTAHSNSPVPGADVLDWARLLCGDGPEKVLVVDGIGGPDSGPVATAAGPSGPGVAALAALDQFLDAQSQFPQPVDDPSWLLEVDGFDPLREREVESWLTVANGRCGTRGSLEEGRPEASPAVYVAGVFGYREGILPVPELVRGPEWTRLHPRAGDETVELDPGEIVEHRRVLDLRQGIVFRTWRQRLGGGDEWRFRSARLASLADRNLLALQAEANVSGRTVALGRPVPLDAEQPGVEAVETRAEGDQLRVVVHATGGARADFAIATEDTGSRLTRLAALGRSGLARPEEELARAAAEGMGNLLARHRLAWRDRWEDADGVVRGGGDVQRAVRFALYHLISSADPDSDVASIGARGLSGPGYRGHVFWDTEVFALPFFVFTHPATARALLAYRHRTLPAARAKAQSFGFEGALYAWESADTGEETTPLSACRSDGTAVDILTGLMEHHISGDVAWATWRYWQATADVQFLVDMGAEMIIETARFWASRACEGSDACFHISGVIGPDEYHEGVDDNAFTNVLARWNLRTAAELCALLPTLDAGAWERLQEVLSLRPSEPARWRVVADRLVDGFDQTSLLYEQFGGFFSLEDVRAADLAPRPFTGDVLLGPERTGRAQMVKQADVLMLAQMLPEELPDAVIAANYRYYEPRTCHGSSLSPAVHACVAARVGALDDAERYFGMAGAMDLDDRMSNSAHGVHLATMGGLWQVAVFGFGGVRPDGSVLRFDPRLGSWDGLAFPLQWRGTRIRVDVAPERLCLELDGPATIALGTGPPRELSGGRFVADRAGHAWTSLRPAGG
jgi:trehalose/maltose hydrolase-like predicted phosphorylase